MTFSSPHDAETPSNDQPATMELSNNEIFIALFFGFVALIVMAMIIVYFRKKHLKKVNEKLRAKHANMAQAV
ncbi:Tumor necrosis factor receptor superfamily member 17 [Lasiodiplodia theobromae]|uniref:Uncharacterized protein n=1 Tax=Lasiodiplodia theobromae TaxID=45133 RepID=A0A5N5D5A3_9PEZI|nr:Tumor necrosis factor receptor superfamily member 17 [Lasiodiplodia theobromae]KAB2572936.1 hypothetical protein DBV05_g8410 [Lasiodiplodia theobromae]KAF4544345.1 Tumor necrosis factor receptor superfamily member 17 [Lasiodiplodia theobromae]